MIDMINKKYSILTKLTHTAIVACLFSPSDDRASLLYVVSCDVLIVDVAFSGTWHLTRLLST